MIVDREKRKAMLEINSPKLFFTGGIAIDVTPGLTIKPGVTVLTGDNGSGKTIFAKIITFGRNFRTNSISGSNGKYPSIKYIEFHDIHSWAGFSVSYYQQRYEASMNDDVPKVCDILKDRCENPLFKELCRDFELRDIENKKINFLSSGELRKILIINALTETPDLLILDNPYIGLDKDSKAALNKCILKLKETGKSVMLIVADIKDAPKFSDYFLLAQGLKIYQTEKPDIKDDNHKFQYHKFPFSITPSSIEEKDDFKEINETSPVCELKDCNISYGSREILKNLSWTVKAGERWSLSGPNGSGKSTLLSILNADNPRGYSCKLSLFGRKRGSGESIWDIKKKIGYVSPEMQLYFKGSGKIVEIVANGLNDTVGMYVKPTEEQLEKAWLWLRHFNIEHLAERSFPSLSAGERQLVLIIRAMIKEPDLLILDEPMHALDSKNRNLVEHTINNFLESYPQSAFIMVTHNPEFLPANISHSLKL